MRVEGKPYRTIWAGEGGWSVDIIDQTRLPDEFVIVNLTSLAQVAHAIRTMQVRGAPLIGVAAAYGVAIAMRDDPSEPGLSLAIDTLVATRPTAINLRWAAERMRSMLAPLPDSIRADAAYHEARMMADEDVATCEAIGAHGLTILKTRWEERRRPGPLNVLTHCNAGWLATVDWGTALAPVYRAHDEGLPIHVWVDETRPRNQGYLTAWELGQHGVPYTVIADNAGGGLMQEGEVDLCIVGTDRVTRVGDVCNKIGTYLKALAARDNGLPFYVGAPSSSIDWSIDDSAAIPIEERDPSELVGSRPFPAKNPAFDVTPARLITGLITERGVCPATSRGLDGLFPEAAGRQDGKTAR
ncbi:MAG: S-methyl-5-thioribose-1-phosphate isomerase [Gemmatimonadota bacterium]